MGKPHLFQGNKAVNKGTDTLLATVTDTDSIKQKWVRHSLLTLFTFQSD